MEKKYNNLTDGEKVKFLEKKIKYLETELNTSSRLIKTLENETEIMRMIIYHEEKRIGQLDAKICETRHIRAGNVIQVCFR